MSVSKSTILLNLPNPVKKAFERVERREASIRQTPRILKPSAFAVAARSIGNDVPASAAAPNGLSFSRRRASAKRPRSRAAIST